LISAVLRRLLLGLADQGGFEPAWSQRIGEEWRRNASRLWSVATADIQMQWDALQQAFPQADQGDVGPFIVELERSDPKDWHVIAAARAAQARPPLRSVGIVTRNVRDFNRSELRKMHISLFDPDQFLARCWQESAALLIPLFDQIGIDALAAGRQPEPLEIVLKRERLFRLNKMCAPGSSSGSDPVPSAEVATLSNQGGPL
jgi:hypothetical protein